MINSEDVYHEMVTIEIEKRILEESGLIAGQDFKMLKVDVPDYEYEHHQRWIEQKRKSTKEYKKLKQIEFELVHNGTSGSIPKKKK